MTASQPTTPKFAENSLQYNYIWTTVKQTQNNADNNYIDVTNGYDVLRFINNFFETHALSSAQTFNRIEMLLHHLPLTVNNQKDITNWVRKNWTRNFTGTNRLRLF
ncbi:hypothetical protein [Flavobacterium subsaxonicum]|uniref:Uncharacterized protein n=1 Tax=Flavobacterium subsaxonicum WB 4.1-42 = DSM 21790 TaxID=1121898 RepID=A0A0A2MQE3_9FLAO|nr:hypothetical protein [Flavobacterium subsaxonicum]KGO94907.1 hypothetical protein Q766_01975 [Flavobacterium subsaxonicum WB 4.1-42 = DSM 21790]